MKKVFLIGSGFRAYNESFRRGFQSNGCEVKVYTSTTMFESEHLLINIKKRLGFDTSNYRRKKITEQSLEIYKQFLEYKPNIVFVRLGNQIDASIVKKMSELATTILYLGDTLENYPELIKISSSYDLVYTFEITDIDKLNKVGVHARPLMGNLDTTQYYPIQVKKDIDVSFVGAMYPERYKLLLQLTKDLPEYNFRFYGKVSNRLHLIEVIKNLFNTNNKRSFHNYNINYDDVNKLYNKSKICLNIQRSETKYGWNSRLCEILGTKSLQLVNGNPEIANNFEGCLVQFKGYQDLKSKIIYYLNNNEEREQLAKRGFRVVMEKHTIEKDMERILNDVAKFINNEMRDLKNDKKSKVYLKTSI